MCLTMYFDDSILLTNIVPRPGALSAIVAFQAEILIADFNKTIYEKLKNTTDFFLQNLNLLDKLFLYDSPISLQTKQKLAHR